MSIIDKQRIAAIRKLEQLGYTFAGDDWTHSANDAAAIAPTIRIPAPERGKRCSAKSSLLHQPKVGLRP